MPSVFACVNVQFIFAPFDRLVLVCLLIHDPVRFVAKVTLSVWFWFPSCTVHPTAVCSLTPVVPFVGCGPVALGGLFVQFACVL